MTTPIFIFSLPRAGSTLLQRMLLAHPKIGGTAEPWLLLPFVYTMREYGTIAEYSHETCHKAFTDFMDTLPEKKGTYLNHLSMFANQLYNDQLKDDQIFFVDKTPRYYLIIPEIAKMFPNAKFIFLFRNPLAVLSSVINTWNNGKMRLHGHHMDLMWGPRLLAEGYEILKDRSVVVQYEDLITDTDNALYNIFEYLGIEYNEEIKMNFNNVSLSGRMGDSVGQYEYDKVEKVTLEKWKKTLDTRRRKSYAKRYLQKIGTRVLQIHGYSYNDLVCQIDSIKVHKSGYICDNFDLAIGFLLRVCSVFFLREKVKNCYSDFKLK